MATRSGLSCNGRLELRRRRYQIDGGGTGAPVDEWIGLASSGVSLAVREMCCRVATDSGSFTRAASNLARLAQLKLSDEKLRQVAQSEGRAVLAWQESEQLELDFDARSCLTDQSADGSVRSRLYAGIDGFLLPMVTDAEMGRRFEKAAARRGTLPRRKGVRRAKLQRRKGADQRYKEMKLVTLYDQEKEHRLVRVTGKGVKHAGRLLRQMSGDVGLRRAREVVAVADGAEWIARLVGTHLPRGTTTAILDYYHASQHVHQARRAVFGEAGVEGERWAEGFLEALGNGPFERWWEELVQTRARVRSVSKRRALDDLMRYLIERREKVDYAAFRAAGFDVGSGPTESMVALEALHQSNLWPNYWSTRLAA